MDGNLRLPSFHPNVGCMKGSENETDISTSKDEAHSINEPQNREIITQRRSDYLTMGRIDENCKVSLNALQNENDQSEQLGTGDEILTLSQNEVKALNKFQDVENATKPQRGFLSNLRNNFSTSFTCKLRSMPPKTEITFIPSDEYDIRPMPQKQEQGRQTMLLPDIPIYEVIDPYNIGQKSLKRKETYKRDFSRKCKILTVLCVVMVMCIVTATIVIPTVVILKSKQGANSNITGTESRTSPTLVDISTIHPPTLNTPVWNNTNLELIVNDNFSTFDTNTWGYAITASGSGNWEFQVYTPEERNVNVTENKLYIRPTLTDDRFGENFVKTGTLDVTQTWGECTEVRHYGCLRATGPGIIVNPVMSGKIHTKESFRYGRVEVIAKMPQGDWLWPGISLLPKSNVYGRWPRSGQMTLVESRGNRNYGELGVQRARTGLHWGDNRIHFHLPQGIKDLPMGEANFGEKFINYTLIWKSSGIQVYYDEELILDAPTPADGYAAKGLLSENPWEKGGKDAPFDTEFYLSLKLAVGGTNGYFPDDVHNTPKPKPWSNTYSHNSFPQTDFWDKKGDWLPTWVGDNAALQIKSVKIWKEINGDMGDA
ncbi:unnamed protein product [Owenia fusiformis]|uniref:Uncharacterized protein n=1 Tax=Owenia fusiformis TaxID=6347 RepID=A0A8J1U8B9_OWEFU|nr:unnamed protein product [Owenia fusiformis]